MWHEKELDGRQVIVNEARPLVEGAKLFVGSLSWGVDDNMLREAFEQAGVVTSAVVIMDRLSGRSKGFGFVEMESSEAADAAIDMWHEKELDGRNIMVNKARARSERPERSERSYERTEY
ncbi:RNA-binding protein [Candidatus Peregrinibacteria bacterium]|nr:MAG: RNA-binding protein [Candidatus Peregrinibacteria bacterium]